MNKYILNPAYILRKDGDRYLLCSKNNYKTEEHRENFFSFIHPLNAQLISLFNGEKKLNSIIKKASIILGLSEIECKNIIEKMIENKKMLSINYKGDWMYYPQRLIIQNNNNYEPRLFSNIENIDKVDLKTERLNFPLSINLNLTMNCFTSCIYCYANRKMKFQKVLTLENILSIIDQAYEGGVVNFDINGGEVLLHPNYKEIIYYLNQKEYIPVISTKVPITNDKIKVLKETGINSIQISLDSANIETLKKLLKVKDDYLGKIKNTLHLLNQSNIEVKIATILTSMNSTINEIKDLFELINKYNNIQDWRISPAGYSLYSDTKYKDFRISEIQMNKIKEYISILKSESPYININLGDDSCKSEYDPQHKIENFPNRGLCTGNVRGMTILPDGRVTICEELYEHPQFILGDLTKNTIEEVWNSDKAKKLFYLTENNINPKSACKKCNDLVKCRQDRGVCWKIVLMAYGNENWDYPDPRCPKAPFPYEEIYLE